MAECPKRFGLREPFHMTDFMSGTRLSPLKRDQILFTLSNIVKSSTARPFAAGMDMKAYKKVNEEFALEGCHTPRPLATLPDRFKSGGRKIF
jgi:hypothetical protein